MEGYEEIVITNYMDSNKSQSIKSCNKCKYRCSETYKNSDDLYGLCDLIRLKNTSSTYKFILYYNIYGHFEPPGMDGEGCPLHQIILRDKKLKILDI